ncbi:MAG: hypothetical protein QGH23_02885 [Dehalococcoidia bacterium]|nr:hypothetical protein [Dehalococcoidia bacterium]
MARGEVTINTGLCQGCGLCIGFCSRGCLELSPDRLSDMGSPQPILAQPERCNACCVCAWLCPDFAIDVYKHTGVA